MRWSLPLLFALLFCARCDAVIYTYAQGDVYLLTNAFTDPAGPGLPLMTSDFTKTVNIDDRSDLIANLPIRVSVSYHGSGGFGLRFEGTASYQNVITISAVLGTNTFSTTSTIDSGPLEMAIRGMRDGGFEVPTFGMEFLVPWDTDLTALPLRISQYATVSGAGNEIRYSGFAINVLSIVTQSIPEPHTGVLSAAALIAGLRRRRVRPV